MPQYKQLVSNNGTGDMEGRHLLEAVACYSINATNYFPQTKKNIQNYTIFQRNDCVIQLFIILLNHRR